MSNAASGNKTIAKNTGYMYVRFIVTLLLGLYISRVALAALGVSDFGLYSVVGGILAMFTFISHSLSQATARFLNYEMGKPDGNVNRIFSISLSTHIAMAAIILIIGEIGGLYYIYNYLNVEPGRIPDAVFCFETALVVACIGITNTPYSSLFMAKEKFGFLSSLDIINTFIRLGLVLSLQFVSGNVLRLYALIMVVTTINTFVIYHFVAHKRWPEIIKFSYIKGWNNYKEVLSFGWWNLLSTMAETVRLSGSDIIVNFFCGTAINGAYSLGRTISQHAITITTFFNSTSSPQIIQAYSANDGSRCSYLINKIGRIILLLFALVFFPLWIELDFVLHVWLGDVPDGVLLLSKLNLILAYISITSGGIYTLINATGKIKWFKVVMSSFFILCLPVGFVLLKAGMPYYVMLILFIVADVLHRGVQLAMVKKILNYDIVSYMKEAYLRPSLLIIIMSFVLFLYSKSGFGGEIWQKLLAIAICFLVTAFVVFYVGLKKTERRKIISVFENRKNNRFNIVQ